MAINHQIYERLKEAAGNGELITYEQVATIVDLSLEDSNGHNEIFRFLKDITSYEYREGRPLLSVLVVLADKGLPGEEFFNLARQLGVYHGRIELEDNEFFEKEKKRVYEFWKSS